MAIEEEFGVEFPDALLTRATFGSIDLVAAAVSSLVDGDAASAARKDAA